MNDLGQRSWVSLKQRVSLFDMYVESVRGFKSRYYIVRPETQAGKYALYKRELDKNADGTVKKNEDGTDKTKEVGRFQMSWTNEHFKKDTDHYLIADSSMTVAEKQGFELLQNFVKSFLPAMAREPFLDEDGNEQFVPRLILTRILLECETRAEVHEVLGTKFEFTSHFLRVLVTFFVSS
jgi:hypothetical protein